MARLVIANAPIVQEWTLEMMDTIFVPRTVARQLALAVALDAGMVTMSSIVGAVQSMLSNFSSRSRLIRHLKEKQKKAETQDDWIELALKIDNVQGNDVWRYDLLFHCMVILWIYMYVPAIISLIIMLLTLLLTSLDLIRTVHSTNENASVHEWMNLFI